MIISCPECNGKVSTEADSCPHCGYKTKRAPTNPPDAGTPAERLVKCPECGKPNWRESSVCYACQTALQGASPAAPEPSGRQNRSEVASFPDISAKLPQQIRSRLIKDEPAYAYVTSSGGCGGTPTELLVTDSRVMVRGVDLNKKEGCGNKQMSALDIPIAHVSSVSEEDIDTGCGKQKGIGIASGSARQGVTAGGSELDGALRILQALIRAHSRR